VGETRLSALLDKEELLVNVMSERDSFRDLVTLYKAQRDEYKELRNALQGALDNSVQLQDTYREQREGMEKELEIVESKYLEEATNAAELQVKYNNSWSDWEVGLFTSGVGAVALLAGVGITVLVVELQ
jgi:DNA mismatch repair ATPase MutS